MLTVPPIGLLRDALSLFRRDGRRRCRCGSSRLDEHDPGVWQSRSWRRILANPRISDGLRDIEDRVRYLSGRYRIAQEHALRLDRFQRDLLFSPIVPGHVVAGMRRERLTRFCARDVRREGNLAVVLVYNDRQRARHDGSPIREEIYPERLLSYDRQASAPEA